MVKASFQYFFDIQTVADEVIQLFVKSGGDYAQKRLLDYFARFKYYKPGKVTITIRPCATLPVDPAGLSLEAGQQNVDPRDMFALGMARITNNEDIGIVSDLMNSMTADQKKYFYNQMLLDHRWYKFSPHRGLTKSATPLLWDVCQVHEDHFPGANRHVPYIDKTAQGYYLEPNGGCIEQNVYKDADHPELGEFVDSIACKFVPGVEPSESIYRRRLVQNGRVPITWMPTDDVVRVNFATRTGESPYTVYQKVYTEATMPEVNVMCILLPPAYRTFNFFRIWVTETCYFKGFREQFTGLSTSALFGDSNYSAIDTYVRSAGVEQLKPTESSVPVGLQPKMRN